MAIRVLLMFATVGLAAARADDPPTEVRIRDALRTLKGGSDADRLKGVHTLGVIIRREGFGTVPVADVTAGLAAAADGDRNRQVRAIAGKILATAPHDSTLPALVRALDDPDRGVRVHACRWLGALGPKARAAAPALTAGVKAARFDASGFAALAAVIGRDAIPVIDAAVDDVARVDPNAPDVAAAVLIDLADPRAAGAMTKALDSDQPVRAAMYFAKLGDGPSLAHLRRCLGRMPPDPTESGTSTRVRTPADLRMIAVEALGRHKDAESFDAILRMVVDDPSIRVRTAAAAALGEYADGRAVPALAKALGQNDEGFSAEGHRDGELYATAVRALDRIGTDDALAVLYEQLRVKRAVSPGIRLWSVWYDPKADKPKRLAAFLRLYDAKPIDPDVAAGVLQMLLHDKDATKPTAEQQAAAEAEFRKGVDDPARFGPAADLSEGGKYAVRTTLVFHRDGFVTAYFHVRRASGGFGHGYTVVYRKTGERWQPVGRVAGPTE